jgi:uncharacterized protein (TIRG00374 family)
MNRGRLLRVVAALMVGGATIAILVRTGTGPGDILGFASPRAHVITLTILVLDLVCRGLRMVILSRTLGFRVRLRTAIASQLAGETAAALTPARVGSDAGRMVVLRRTGVDLGSSGAIVVAEMAFEVPALLLVASTLMAVAPATRLAWPGILAYAVIVGITTVSAVLLARSAGMHPPAWYSWLRLPHSRWNQLRSASSDFVSACSALGHLRAGTVVVILTLSTLHIVCRLALLPALLLDSLTASLVIPAVAWPLLLLYAGALVPIPGGGGVLELGFAGSIGELLGPAAGAALLWWRIYTFHGLVLAGGIVLFAATIAPRSARNAPPDDCLEDNAARQLPRVLDPR